MIAHKQVESALQSLQQALERAGHWAMDDISAEALASQQPFCLDTMNFSQWLQFVFIPNIQLLIDAQQALPRFVKGQGLEPMASEFYAIAEDDHREILAVIGQIDDLLQINEN